MVNIPPEKAETEQEDRRTNETQKDLWLDNLLRLVFKISHLFFLQDSL